MSRTYRRKGQNWNKVCGNWKYFYITKGEWNEEGIYQRIALEGEELKKSLNHYHSDCLDGYSAPPYYRNQEWRYVKRKEKLEILKWIRNEDYEPQFHEHPRWPYWD